MLALAIVILILIIGAAFCSSSEAAVFTVSKIKVQSLAAQNRPGAKTLLKLKTNMNNTIATLVILNNLFNIVGSIFVGHLIDEQFHDVWIGVFSAAFTFFIILFGEVLPKNFGEKHDLALSLRIAGLVNILSMLFYPVLWLLNRLSLLLIGEHYHDSISEEEIKIMVDLGMRERKIERDEQELIQNVFKMNDKIAQSIMTPRVNLNTLDGNLALSSQAETIYDSQHSRLPVFQDDLDNITGFVLLRDMLEMLAKGEGSKTPSEFIQPLVSVKESTRVDSLLLMFQKKRTHMAVVIDEFGGTSGIVTLEDVLEELVGEIVDETDEVVDMRVITS